MHALWIPSWYPADDQDLAGSFFREQLQALAAAGLRVGALVPHLVPPTRPLTAPRAATEGPVRLVRFPARRAWLTTRRLSTTLAHRQLAAAWRSYVARWGRPDILHAHGLFPGAYFAHHLAVRHALPWVYTEHRSLTHAPARTWGGRASERALVAAAAARTGVSRPHAAALATRFAQPAAWQALPNLAPAVPPPAPRPPGGEPVVGHLSVPHPVKRHDLLLAAFARAFPTRGRLRLAGDLTGPYGATVRALVAANPAADRIDLVGPLPRAAVPTFLANLDVFALPSHSETCGVSLLEALSVGTPVVTTPTWGGRDLADLPHYGRQAAPTVAAFAAALQAVAAENPHTRPARAAATAARYGPAAYTRRVRALYESAS
ncbi:glycosyltransferase [Buchananella hordeovulneris]|uniref:Glycosyltransferase subfamily 4-like N-terminal domain-containing protein n=1 Tax=Buchananella hordeovulneris TaxID=52770 RepID=A0A1Q5PWR0_9ACTO|nr:glycosyltransferase [Buchananella hordeovulneris]OKL51855.1 hypothetical protein BSZ40_05035 [Buchananella hordeovulneris]